MEAQINNCDRITVSLTCCYDNRFILTCSFVQLTPIRFQYAVIKYFSYEICFAESLLLETWLVQSIPQMNDHPCAR